MRKYVFSENFCASVNRMVYLHNSELDKMLLFGLLSQTIWFEIKLFR